MFLNSRLMKTVLKNSPYDEVINTHQSYDSKKSLKRINSIQNLVRNSIIELVENNWMSFIHVKLNRQAENAADWIKNQIVLC